MPGASVGAGGLSWPSLVERPEPARPPSDQPRRVLVLLVDFGDNAQTHSRTEFEKLLFGQETRSMRDYYLEVSYGRLTVEGEIAGWYRLDQPYSYYLGDSFGIFGEYPHNSQGLVADLVAKADPEVDFSRFAGPDRMVEGLLIVHAGPGAEETRSRGDIWSHKWQLSDNAFGSPGIIATQDGVNIDAYTVQPERFSDAQLMTVGVFCHEYGHLLGMPDLYDTDYSSAGLGMFCLMAAGSWARAAEADLPGSSPVHPCAWNKYLVGWTRPESLEPELLDSVTGVEIPAAARTGLSYRILRNPDGVDWQFGRPGRGEYFLIENRQQVGFDAGLPGSGLLILHVDESRPGNENERRPLVGILRADHSPSYALSSDDRGSDAHLWKSSDSGVHPRSVPSTVFYDGVPSGVTVDRISASGTVMTADMRIAPLFLGRVCSFPNPVVVREPGTRATIVYAPTDSVRLAGRYPRFKVQLFNIAGEPVRLLDGVDEIDVEHRAAFWDLRNDRGRPVTSGMYFYLVEITEPGCEEQNHGQLTIVR